MASSTPERLTALESRISALEQRINELQDLMKNSISRRSLNAVAVALEDLINKTEAEIAAAQTDIAQIKQRLGI